MQGRQQYPTISCRKPELRSALRHLEHELEQARECLGDAQSTVAELRRQQAKATSLLLRQPKPRGAGSATFLAALEALQKERDICVTEQSALKLRLQRLHPHTLRLVKLLRELHTAGAHDDDDVEWRGSTTETDARAVFEESDKRGSGALGTCELHAALRKLKLDASSEEAVAVLRSCDADGDGTLSLDAFVRLVRELRSFEQRPAPQHEATPVTPEQARVAFEHFDKDSSGALEVREVRAALVWLGLSETDRAEALIALGRFDADGDGRLTLDEFTQLTREVLKYQQSSEVRPEVRAAFELFDTDSSGGLSTRELTRALAKLGVDPRAKEAIAVRRRFDADGDGVLTLVEFDTFVSAIVAAQAGADPIRPEVRRAFELFNVDGSGSLSLAELLPALTQLGLECSLDEASRILRESDSSHDGSLDVPEFARLVSRIEELQAGLRVPRSSSASGPAVLPSEVSAPSACDPAAEPCRPSRSVPSFLLVCEPGPEADQLQAALLVAIRHAQGAIHLAGAAAVGPNERVAVERARLLRTLLHHLGAGHVPVGYVEVPGVGPSEAGPKEYALRGFEHVRASSLLPGALLVRQCLRSSPPRSLCVACCCALSPIQQAIRENPELFVERVATLGSVGGVLNLGSGWVVDESARAHAEDLDAAKFVYRFCKSHRVALCSLSVQAAPPLPLGLSASLGRIGGELWRYLCEQQHWPLFRLWQSVVYRTAPPGQDLHWFASTFCTDASTKLSPRLVAELAATDDLEPHLRASLPAPASTLVLAMLPDSCAQILRAAPEAEQFLDGAAHVFFTAESPLPAAPLLYHLQRACAATPSLQSSELGRTVQKSPKTRPSGVARRSGYGGSALSASAASALQGREKLLILRVQRAIGELQAADRAARSAVVSARSASSSAAEARDAALQNWLRETERAQIASRRRLSQLQMHSSELQEALATERCHLSATSSKVRSLLHSAPSSPQPTLTVARKRAERSARASREHRSLHRSHAEAVRLHALMRRTQSELRSATRSVCQQRTLQRCGWKPAPALLGTPAPMKAVPAEARAVFEEFDKAGSGALSTRELQAALRKLKLDASSEEAVAVLRRCDAEGDGTLSLDAFARLVRELRSLERRPAPQHEATPVTPELARVAFEHFDKDSSGALEVREVRAALVWLGLSETDRAEALIALGRFDADGDGRLTLDEFTQLTREVLKYQQSSEVRPEVRAAFELFDTDSSGGLSTRELTRALAKLGVDPRAKEAIAVRRRFDADGDGVLTVVEFDALVSAIIAVQAGADPIRPEVRRAFELFNVDGSCSLSLAELLPALTQLGLECSLDDASRILRESDSSHAGLLDVPEFARLVSRIEEFQAVGGANAAAPSAGDSREPAVSARVRAAFELFDTDSSDGLGTRELTRALAKLGLDARAKEAIAVRRRFDADGDGVLTLVEFDSLVSAIVDAQEEADPIRPEVRRAFELFDVDGSCSLSLAELLPALTRLGLEFSLDEASRILRESDSSHDGLLDMPEFARLVRRIEEYQARSGATAAEPSAGDDPEFAVSAEVRAAFELFDADSSGGLSTRELTPALAKLGVDASTPDAIAVRQGFDADGDGVLTLVEFNSLVKAIGIASSRIQGSEAEHRVQEVAQSGKP